MEVLRKGTNLVRKQNVQVFNNSKLGIKVRTIQNLDGSISINAEDTAKGFGWTTVAKSGNEVIRWNRVNKYISELGSYPQVGTEDFIPESLFYLLGMKANNDIAKKFQTWLAIDVIPQIRKTGGYIPLDEQMDDEEFLARALDIAHKTLKKKDELLKVKTKEIKELKPRADYTDLILQNKALVNVNQIAQDYGMSAQKFNELLNSFRIQYKQNEQWILFAKYKNCGYVGSETFKFTHKSSKKKDIKMNTKWTQKGRKFLYDFLKEKGILPVMEREVI